jgi:hypothetical protein
MLIKALAVLALLWSSNVFVDAEKHVASEAYENSIVTD